ncbi:hypothetical protein CR513_36349, partial [Mucuna pruriens]
MFKIYDEYNCVRTAYYKGGVELVKGKKSRGMDIAVREVRCLPILMELVVEEPVLSLKIGA